jgi:MarR family transcriptional regulator, organic hydroperoxide resistance regulator
LSYSTVYQFRCLPVQNAGPGQVGRESDVEGHSRSEQLDEEILRAVSELIGRIIALGEGIAQRLCVPTFFIKALHTLERPMAMKDLGKRMHCDPSFVTVIADMLEKKGLARREAHPGDRRVKNLVLTGEGLELKHRIEGEMAARMPWSRTLDEHEREQLLSLIRKMLSSEILPDTTAADSPAAPAPASPESAGAESASPESAGSASGEAGSGEPTWEVDDTVSAAPARVGLGRPRTG